MDDLGDRNRLPIRRTLAPAYVASLLIALLAAAAAVAGLVGRGDVYPTPELQESFVANDVVNLALGVPILLGTMGLTWRGHLLGLLCWPGAILFTLYNAIAYLLALPLTWPFLLYLALVALCAYTLIGLVAAIDGPAVQRRLAGAVPERLAGGILAGLGTLFLLRALAVVAGALYGGSSLAATDLAVNAADFLTAPALVIGGVLLWRRRELGYVAGLGLLFQASMLFIALMAFLLLQPVLTAAPFAPVDLAVIAAMGLVCFVPFGLFVRGVLAKKR